ncbi:MULTISPECIES: hypothetical protein [unclassified Bartonella]|uniref:hypothetical protein n=1 Tax=unclassified Bartonella TaxID=2645622 RepID=UPI0035D0E574
MKRLYALQLLAKKFATLVEHLIRNDKLIEKDNGLSNTRVEEELKDFTDKKSAHIANS